MVEQPSRPKDPQHTIERQESENRSTLRNTTNGYLLLREYVAEDGYVYSEVWGRPNGTEVEMRSKPTYMNKNGSGWTTYQKIEKNGEVVFEGVLHRDTYEPLSDTEGEKIPFSDLPVAPVNP